ncbi:hypothetical protein DL93DRAFT_2232500 [Clavulina sp. PMI_390]|nr:hypothetical protein DL93DRAFT_2232500 [Clavulina sp. PMI_390]
MRPTRFSLSRRNASFAAFYHVCCRGLTTQAAPKAVPLSTSRAQPPTDSLARPSANDNVFSSPPVVSRNQVGVQLLWKNLHEQVFPSPSTPPPPQTYVQMARDHLESHDLDPSKASTSPHVELDLPRLQGENIDEHFHRLGTAAAEPARSMSKTLAAATLPPVPDEWIHESGWTKYNSDGSFEFVEDLGDEALITFDVETMPNYSNYAIIAAAATPTAWYIWLSPWLLGRDSNPFHLIPMGSPKQDRIIVGHNVSYDRARIAEEYNLEQTKNRFIDTMALHVAVRGISSPQRPSWMRWRKEKREQKEMNAEALSSLRRIARRTEANVRREKDANRQRELQREMAELMESISDLDQEGGASTDSDGALTWEDVSSLSSLAEVAHLYCGIDMNKEPRGDFMKLTPEEIFSDLDSYITYCAQDVFVTHSVFTKVLPLFFKQCPHPVSFAGMAVMGSSFLPVNETWQEYIQKAESTYRASEAAILSALRDLAIAARELFTSGDWQNDPWLSQLDWTPKSVRQNRLAAPTTDASTAPPPSPPESVVESDTTTVPSVATDGEFGPRADGVYGVPVWLSRLASFETLSPENEADLSVILGLTLHGHTLSKSTLGWMSSWDGATASVAPPNGHLLHDGLLPDVKSGQLKSSILTKKQLSSLVTMEKSSTSYRDAVLYEAARIVAPRRAPAGKIKLDPGYCAERMADPAYSSLDWSVVLSKDPPPYVHLTKAASKKPKVADTGIVWPKWYYDLAAPKKDKTPGDLDLTPRTRASVLLLRLSWRGFPLFHSRQHGWTFRVDPESLPSLTTRQKPLNFKNEPSSAAIAKEDPDAALAEDVTERGFAFFKLPHKDGEDANVGSPLSKTFLPYAMDGTLASPNEMAMKALQMNAECSYWISARERIMGQMVINNTVGKVDLGIADSGGHHWGMILPQVVTMGAVTRRAMERTWLTASNAKKNRVGSELKAMVRAPPGYAIVGADVDSEELWLASVMGDAQFGLHGASALGWMTLEGTKSQGTDLHSKTAKILGITRDQAKIFNYSRIYGAGKKHAELLLLQANSSLDPQKARLLANDLYASTKGKKSRKGAFGQQFWFGGTESLVFNRLEQIATSHAPQTPALGCGITSALTAQYLVASPDSDFMPSRVNWAVQSSGSDYLHLLLVTMEYLMQKYAIRGRYLISVHDEVRYLVREEDKYRLALALQIANLWTRSLFAYRLGFDDLPQGVAFFSAVDIDHVLRKEVDMPCVTPSQPIPIPPGESVDIYNLLKTLPSPTLGPEAADEPLVGNVEGYVPHDGLRYRAEDPEWLQAQVTMEGAEVQALWKRLQARKPELALD